MTRERFLTVRWNNILSLLVGLPALAYVIVALSTSSLSDFDGFLGLLIIGAVF